MLGHETEFNRLVPGGGFWAAHDSPPFVVPMMVDPAPVLPLFPTAMQSTAVEHEMPVRSTALGGGLWSDHVEPLFDVPTTYGVELRLVPTRDTVVSIGQVTRVELCCQKESKLVSANSSTSHSL